MLETSPLGGFGCMVSSKKFRNVHARKCFLKGYWQGNKYPAKLSGVAVKVHWTLALTNNPKFMNQSCYWAKISWENVTEQHTKQTIPIHMMGLILLSTCTHALVEEQVLSSIHAMKHNP